MSEAGLCGGALTPCRQTCALCKVKDVGACIKCEDCNKHFHAGCAWTAGFRFGFEIHPLKKKRAKEVTPVKFKDEDGASGSLQRFGTQLTHGSSRRDDGLHLVS